MIRGGSPSFDYAHSLSLVFLKKYMLNHIHIQSFLFKILLNIGLLQTPQSPIVRTSSYAKYGIDEYPSGTNAIVAVLAYTG